MSDVQDLGTHLFGSSPAELFQFLFPASGYAYLPSGLQVAFGYFQPDARSGSDDNNPFD